MSTPLPPIGRVQGTRFRDTVRALVRAVEPQPARPTKTIIAPEEGTGARARSTDAVAETMPLVGGWSLSAEGTGLWLVHEDGSRQQLATRTTGAAPATTTEGADHDG